MKILLVDDDEIAVAMMAEALSSCPDYQIEIATDSVKALSRILEGDIAVVISDWMMPRMTGTQLCQSVRKAELRNYVFFVIVTSRDGAGDVVEGFDSGADEFLTKPVNPAELLARVRSIQRLRELENRVVTQNEKLREIQTLKDDWTNMIVHDLRTPMAAILGYSELLVMKLPPELASKAEVIRRQSQHVSTMLEDMLLMAKSETGNLKVCPEPVDLVPLLQEAIRGVTPQAESRRIPLQYVPGRESFEAELDPALVRRVVDNLLSNAIRFSEAPSPVRLVLEPCDGVVKIAVEDEGPGVPEAARETIFEKYVTLESGHSGRSKHGLGLAFCRVVAEAHQGRIVCLPRTPKGSRFEMSLPLLVASSAPGSPPHATT